MGCSPITCWLHVYCARNCLIWTLSKFPFTLCQRNLKTQHYSILDWCLFVFEENSSRGITWFSWSNGFCKALLAKMFPVHTKMQSWRFQTPLLCILIPRVSSPSQGKGPGNEIAWCDERFREATFLWRISVKGRPNHRKKAAFLIFFSLAQIKNYFGQFGKLTNNRAHVCTGFWADNVIMMETC